MQPDIQHPGDPHRAGLGNGIAPLDVGFFQTCQIQRHPLAGIGGVHVFSVNLQIANPGGSPGGYQFRRIALPDGTFDQRAGDHGAEAFHGKNTVNGQPEGDAQAFFLGFLHQFPEHFL